MLVSAASVAVICPVHAFEADRAPQTLYVQAAQDDLATGAKDFVQSMAQRGIDFLSDQSLTQDKRTEHFRKLLRSSYDLRTIGRFALGSYWKVATPGQQSEYQKLFEKMVVDVYSRRFSEYKGQQLEVRGSRQESDTDVMVSSVIVPAPGKGGEEVPVDWRVRKKEGQYKVIDVIVAGVSMAMTQRSEFSSVIQRGGGNVDILLQHLRG